MSLCVGLIVLGAMVIAAAALALASTSGFPDVPASDPYYAAITDLASRGIIGGYANGTFGPADPVTRQQFAKMIVKTLAYPVPATIVCTFSDVDLTPNAGDPLYPAKYVAVCAEKGITTGKTPTTFDPLGPITRQQLISMVARAAELHDPPASYTPSFSPGQFSLEEHYLNARRAAYAGLMDGLVGVGPSYGFLASSSRGECAQLLHNLATRLGSSTATSSSSTTTTLSTTSTTLPATGDLTHFWWSSGQSLGGWQMENVSKLLGGQQVGGDMDSCGPLPGSAHDHVFAASAQGDLLMFTVTPGEHDWQVANLSTLTGTKIAPSGVWSFSTGSESLPTLHLMTINPDHDLLHFWRPPDGSWHSEDVSQEVVTPPRSSAKVAGAPSISWDGSVPESEGNMVTAPGLANQLLLFHFHADTGRWDLEDVSAGLAVTLAGETEADDVPGLELIFTDVLGRFQFLTRTSSTAPWSLSDVSSLVGYQFAHGPADIIIPGSITTEGARDAQVHYLGTSDQAALIHLWRDSGGTWHTDNVSAKTGQPVAHLMHAFADWTNGSQSELYYYYVGVAPNHDLIVSAGDLSQGQQARWLAVDVTGRTGLQVNMGEAFWWDEGTWQGNLMVTHYGPGQG